MTLPFTLLCNGSDNHFEQRGELNAFQSNLRLHLVAIVTIFLYKTKLVKSRATVSCSPLNVRLGGVGLWSWLTGKLGSAWVGAMMVHGLCMGAWVVVMCWEGGGVVNNVL